MIHVAIVADLRLYRDGLAELLCRVDGIAVVGAAEAQPRPVRALLRLRPDVVLVDMAMIDNTRVIRFVARQAPRVKIVALGVPETEEMVLSCVEAGIAAYVGRDRSFDDVVATVNRVVRGQAVCTPEIVASLFRHVAALATQGPQRFVPSLTRRELQIASLIARGLSNKEIARDLHIELSTVKNHIHNIFEKLRISRRSQVTAWVANGFDELGDLEPFGLVGAPMPDRSRSFV